MAEDLILLDVKAERGQVLIFFDTGDQFRMPERSARDFARLIEITAAGARGQIEQLRADQIAGHQAQRARLEAQIAEIDATLAELHQPATEPEAR